MQSSMTGDVATENRKRDPDNVLLWRMNPRPLEAEAIRDSLLSVSGLLDLTKGGPDLDFNDDAPKPRRSLYYRHAPEKMMPFLTAFDAAGPTECYRRTNTVVPQQAMALVNSRLSGRAAEAAAKDLAGKPPEEFIAATFLRLLGRMPTPAEIRPVPGILAKEHSRLARSSFVRPRRLYDDPVIDMHAFPNRRSFLPAGTGLAGLALTAMLHRDGLLRADDAWTVPDGKPHFPPKIKRVIWLFMIGGTSHVEAFDPNRCSTSTTVRRWRRRRTKPHSIHRT